MYQVGVLLVLNFAGKSILGLKGDKVHAVDVKNTVIFNAFVLCQVSNIVENYDVTLEWTDNISIVNIDQIIYLRIYFLISNLVPCIESIRSKQAAISHKTNTWSEKLLSSNCRYSMSSMLESLMK